MALLSWAVASPVGASPDDDYHLNSIWCGDGIREGLCAPGPTDDERVVPVPLAASPCFALKPNLSASCQKDGLTSGGYASVATKRGNWTGDYPPLFYAVMGAFAGQDIPLSVILMRVFNAVLFVGITTALYFLLPFRRRPILAWSLAITLVPLGMFLIPSTNPSSWALISAGTLWIALLGFFESSGQRRLGLGLLATLATVIGAAARADAAIYAILAIGVVVMLSARRERRFIVSLALPIALVLIAGYFYLSSGQSSIVESGLVSGNVRGDWKQLLFVNILNVPTLWAGALGFWGIGWQDTVLPSVVWVSTIAVFSALVFTGMRTMGRRKGLATAGIFGAMWAIPTYVLVRSHAYVGEQFQPRYILPLMILLAGLALFNSNGRVLKLARFQTILVVVALSLANSVALHFNIRRYVTGADAIGWNLNAGVEWWWAGALSPMAVWAIGSVTFAGVVAALFWRLLSPAQAETHTFSRVN
ncbi:DUF2142 domain-containing protein [Cryobacterium sp. 10I1]|nr:DUF2142 domain-containing protein [Cryobacterium sp. 10I1]